MINAHVRTIVTVTMHPSPATQRWQVTVSGGDFAIIGGMTAVHQFCIIGAHVMVGGCSGVAQDVPPYVIAQGNHATPFRCQYRG